MDVMNRRVSRLSSELLCFVITICDFLSVPRLQRRFVQLFVCRSPVPPMLWNIRRPRLDKTTVARTRDNRGKSKRGPDAHKLYARQCYELVRNAAVLSRGLGIDDPRGGLRERGKSLMQLLLYIRIIYLRLCVLSVYMYIRIWEFFPLSVPPSVNI